MFRYLIKQLRLLWFSCLFLLLTQPIFGGDEPWRPVSPAERQMTASSVESGADAEILFWEVRLNDATQNLIEENYVRVPNYAQKTGKRMFVQPGVFEANAKPVFSASTRVHDIYFSYPWEVHDNISIQYPESFELDNPDVPAEVSDPRKIGVLNISIGHNPATRTLYYKRDFQFGSGESIQFPAAFYSSIKNLFDGFHRASAHSLSLRQK